MGPATPSRRRRARALVERGWADVVFDDSIQEHIRAHFEPLVGADDLELLPRLPDRDPPGFD